MNQSTDSFAQSKLSRNATELLVKNETVTERALPVLKIQGRFAPMRILGSGLLFVPFLVSVLAACAGGSSSASSSEDYSSSESEFRIDYEEGMLWANSLSQQLIREAEDSGSDYPRYEGFSSAVSQMVDIYGGLAEGCMAVVDYNFGSEFPEGPQRDAWVAGCLSEMERAQETADSIRPDS